MNKVSPKYSFILICAALVLAVFIAFSPLSRNDFINYDDNQYITKNQNVQAGLTAHSIKWAFTAAYAGNWHPLTWLSHMLDCRLFGLNPKWHHLVNLLFHITNTLLLFWVLKDMTGGLWQSAFVAAAFALHPLHVESVAWVAERKDVLSTLFWLLTMAAYLCYVKNGGAKWYLATLLLFALGLMAKPMLVTLPFVLLLLDYWPLERLTRHTKYDIRYTLYEKLPFFILSAISSVITFFVQRSSGAVSSLDKLHFGDRIANALFSCISYLGKMLCPVNLGALYPHHRLPDWKPIIALVILALITANVIYHTRRHHYLAVGWLWYIGTLVPVIGLVQVGTQSMADRYTYVPSIGIFIMVAWGAAELLRNWKYRKPALAITASAILLVLLIHTRIQVRYWRNSISLYEHTLAVTENNSVMHFNLGHAYQSQNNLDQAVKHYLEAIRLRPKDPEAHNNLATIFLQQNRIDEAIAYFRKAVEIKPAYADAYYNLGRTLQSQGKFDEAIKYLNKNLEIRPGWPEIHNWLALTYAQAGRLKETIDHCERSLKLDPNQPKVYKNLGTIFDAQRDFIKAAHYWGKALEFEPNSVGLINNLAWFKATQADPNLTNHQEAVRLALRACEMTDFNQPDLLDTLAAAYASIGKFTEAIKTAEKAQKLAETISNKNLAEDLRTRLQLYKTGQPYHEK
jgi:tetratricopeptide (TPR) repeat protein